MNDEDNAFADFNMAIKLDGKIAESWANQALIYERRGDKAKAAKSYQQAVRLDPNYKPAKDGLARTQRRPEPCRRAPAPISRNSFGTDRTMIKRTCVIPASPPSPS